MSSNLTWEFKEFSAGVGPARSDSQALKGSGLRTLDLLIRESIQNSADESSPQATEPVKIRIETRELLGESKRKFVESLDLRALRKAAQGKLNDDGWFDKGLTALEKLDDPDSPIPVLIYSDFNTNGLTGHWKKAAREEDRFHRLVLALYRSAKQTTDGHLGSYGLGKMCFSLCSDIRTVGYYSRFNPSVRSYETDRRMMFTAALSEFSEDLPNQDESRDFTGHSYLGARSGDSNFPSEPLTNDRADTWISDIGCEPRGETETGLTVVIPFCNFQINEIRQAIESWWWPRLIDSGLHSSLNIELLKDGRRVPPPAPQNRSDLIPFIDLYRAMPSRVTGESITREDLAVKIKRKAHKAGCLLMKKATEGTREGIALIRGGMIITYDTSLALEGKADVTGIFVPNEEYLKYWIYSEPEAHHRFDPNQIRLAEKYPDGPQFIRAALEKLKTTIRDYQKTFDERKTHSNREVAGFLDKHLSGLFKNRKKGMPTPPTNTQRAFSIQKKRQERVAAENGTEDRILYEISLSEHVAEARVPTLISVTLKASGNSDGSKANAVQSKLTNSEGIALANPLQTTLSQGTTIQVFATANVNPSWTTKWDVDVRKDTNDD